MEKVLAGKEGASIFQELYLPLRVIYFSNLLKGFEINSGFY